jgi:ubiquitin
MIELFLLMIFNLLYPDKNKAGSSKDDMNTAAAFFYGTSYESIGKETTNPHPDKTPQEQQTVSEDHCDYCDDWLDW